MAHYFFSPQILCSWQPSQQTETEHNIERAIQLAKIELPLRLQRNHELSAAKNLDSNKLCLKDVLMQGYQQFAINNEINQTHKFQMSNVSVTSVNTIIEASATIQFRNSKFRRLDCANDWTSWLEMVSRHQNIFYLFIHSF